MATWEEEKIKSIRNVIARGKSRQDVLAGLNDGAKYTLEQIADFIQEMGWDKEDA